MHISAKCSTRYLHTCTHSTHTLSALHVCAHRQVHDGKTGRVALLWEEGPRTERTAELVTEDDAHFEYLPDGAVAVSSYDQVSS